MQSHSSPSIKPAGSSSSAYPAMPASPTLTNPDLILPDYDDPISPDRSQSPLMMWQNAQDANTQFDLNSQSFVAGPITPTTPIIYGNGTMLSDIGEVTEVESTCAPTRARSASTRSEFAIVTSTALPYEAIKKRIKESRAAHERHTSIDSTSTVTNHNQADLFADFDDSVSVDDSNFQGDDEDSVADSYIDETSVQETVSAARPLSHNEDDERYSTPLSRRAEHILANAKRRLNNMEGNLSRARSSLYSPAVSSIGSYSTPSPTVGRPTTSTTAHGHNRISSESNIPTDNKPSVSTQRSSSALGTAGGYRRPGQKSAKTSLSSSVDGDSYAKNKPSLHTREWSLEPLSEDEVLEEEMPRSAGEDARSDVFLTPTFGAFAGKNLKRSSSTAQMRDLKDQVNDLKGRLSTLRDQARADSMKRRSLQSLRTPSPFTHAQVDQWYVERSSHEDSEDNTPKSTDLRDQAVRDHGNQITEIGRVSEEHTETSLDDSDRGDDVVTPRLPEQLDASPASSNGVPDSEPNQENGAVGDAKKRETFGPSGNSEGYLDPEADYYDDGASESGESAYHDSVQAQVSHEDREDAFDYEHFFLHSAMGSMSRRAIRRRGSNESSTSEGSVETTRGPTASGPLDSITSRASRHSRSGSVGSTSTIDSFATATEGRNTRAGGRACYEDLDMYSSMPERARTHTPYTAMRGVFTPDASALSSGPNQPVHVLARRPQSSAAVYKHRPSAPSHDSVGTNRSFPLVNHRTQANGGILTPDGSPDQDSKCISEELTREVVTMSGLDVDRAGLIRMLQKDDQILLERLMGTLSRCIVGLSESGRASTDRRMYRRKIEAAHRILEGLE
ncbi:hypothetical protein GGR57DRAFT_443543 [Xylariaceae sp. FL1272]|nr:hypothetical protein GGR57DRAFT_443543 [Xylariaceae sp. FL1272]